MDETIKPHAHTHTLLCPHPIPHISTLAKLSAPSGGLIYFVQTGGYRRRGAANIEIGVGGCASASGGSILSSIYCLDEWSNGWIIRYTCAQCSLADPRDKTPVNSKRAGVTGDALIVFVFWVT